MKRTNRRDVAGQPCGHALAFQVERDGDVVCEVCEQAQFLLELEQADGGRPAPSSSDEE